MTPNLTVTSKRVDAALAILRLVAGITFIAHGAQKLFVIGLPNVVSGFGEMGIPVPSVTAPLVAAVELFGGIALVIGLLTRLASLGLAIDMVGAILLVHLPNGFFVPNGFEFPLSLLASTTALVLTGAGAYSVDAVRAHRHRAPRPTRPAYAPRPTA